MKNKVIKKLLVFGLVPVLAFTNSQMQVNAQPEDNGEEVIAVEDVVNSNSDIKEENIVDSNSDVEKENKDIITSSESEKNDEGSDSDDNLTNEIDDNTQDVTDETIQQKTVEEDINNSADYTNKTEENNNNYENEMVSSVQMLEAKGSQNQFIKPDIVINEVESNGDTNDWVEIYNAGTTSVDISGWYILDNDPEKHKSDVIPLAEGTVHKINSYYIVLRS